MQPAEFYTAQNGFVELEAADRMEMLELLRHGPFLRLQNAKRKKKAKGKAKVGLELVGYACLHVTCDLTTISVSCVL